MVAGQPLFCFVALQSHRAGCLILIFVLGLLPCEPRGLSPGCRQNPRFEGALNVFSCCKPSFDTSWMCRPVTQPAYFAVTWATCLDQCTFKTPVRRIVVQHSSHSSARNSLRIAAL